MCVARGPLRFRLEFAYATPAPIAIVAIAADAVATSGANFVGTQFAAVIIDQLGGWYWYADRAVISTRGAGAGVVAVVPALAHAFA